MSAPATRSPAAAPDQAVAAVPICWKREGNCFVPNELPIHLEVDGMSKDLSLGTARQLIAQLTEAVERADDAHCILETEAGIDP